MSNQTTTPARYRWDGESELATATSVEIYQRYPEEKVTKGSC
ncbi:hypothetical protein [Mariniblastus fucicola]|uniref:Uncharacterized protein n=1 Tax=Mariniblastus fucicola TaxID=980251 RepID=A0A5B9P140_9BACT|nr:hypothetical protein [Mariniblastus fucicola]QEG20207.1 hypothetical protein MFFC18_00540 [Mariniblastus fucicola]